jgi:shikimate 5-dehydrogenase
MLRVGDELLGVNTNSHAAGWAMKQLMGESTPKQILVAGTSATARSVVTALRGLFPEGRIFIVGRDLQKAQALIDICRTGEAVQDIHAQKYDLVVHATSVGSANDTQRLDYPLEEVLEPGIHFFDVIIGSTHLQQTALSKGCIVTSGAAMQYAASVLRAGLLIGRR